MAQLMTEGRYKVCGLFVGRQHRIRVYPPAFNSAFPVSAKILADVDLTDPIVPWGFLIAGLYRYQLSPILQLQRHHINFSGLHIPRFFRIRHK